MKTDHINKHTVEYVIADRRVIAQIKNCEWDAADVCGCFDDRYRMCFRYKGIAKCAPGDAFDEETGKRIAYRRLEMKYYGAMNRRLFRWATMCGAKLQSVLALMTNNVEKHLETRPNDMKLFHRPAGKDKSE